MFSGKSTELQTVQRRFTHAGMRVLLFNPHINERDRDGLVESHDGSSAVAITFHDALELIQIVINQNPDVVLIEEVHFIPHIRSICVDLNLRGIHVFMAALNEDFEGMPWPHIAEFLHTCEVHQTFAVCKDCGSMRACHSALFSNEVPDENSILIGGEDKFKALCNVCFIAHTGARLDGDAEDAAE